MHTLLRIFNNKYWLAIKQNSELLHLKWKTWSLRILKIPLFVVRMNRLFCRCLFEKIVIRFSCTCTDCFVNLIPFIEFEEIKQSTVFNFLTPLTWNRLNSIALKKGRKSNLLFFASAWNCKESDTTLFEYSLCFCCCYKILNKFFNIAFALFIPIFIWPNETSLIKWVFRELLYSFIVKMLVKLNST